jgi:hypothetical protein
MNAGAVRAMICFPVTIALDTRCQQQVACAQRAISFSERQPVLLAQFDGFHAAHWQ